MKGVFPHLSSHITFSMDFKKLKVPELRELLAKHGLDQTGKKEELITRLIEAGIGMEDDELCHLAPPPQEDDDDSTFTNWTNPPASEPTPTESTNKPVVEEKKEEQHKSINTTEISQLSDLERLKRRAERFGIPLSDEVKKEYRAQRFGIALADNTKENTGSPKKKRKLHSCVCIFIDR
jgi:SAP domain-containing ribonucleoprotein